MPSIFEQKAQALRRKPIFFAGIFAFVIGCASHLGDQSSKSYIPFDKQKVPSLEKAIIIDPKGPALGPQYYEVMGRAVSEASHVSSINSHCDDAIEMLRYEAEKVGGDALIGVSCTSRKFDANADGTIITFRNREEALKVLRDIGAVLK
jgi:hypothetical protein